ncbi:alkyl sulfatase C-terminal domain-containing protein [Actinoplanes sp. NPDC051513]|uniref:alkyl sulfatase C-terminal domain-containing protein n=1 Tax=Actinoplanes sp. NPDC051513 TaxID=3363908 RepID=UPI00379828E9
MVAAVTLLLSVAALPVAALPALAGRGHDGITIDGDPEVLGRLTSVLDAPDPNFAIVTP